MFSIVALGVPALVGVFVLAVSSGLVRTSWQGGLEFAGIVLAFVGSPWLMAILGGVPDTLELGDSGAAFRMLGYPISVPWGRFDATLKAAPNGRLRVSYRTSDRPAGRFSGYAAVVLPPSLAKPFLAHPHAPRWTGPPELLAKWLPDARSPGSR